MCVPNRNTDLLGHYDVRYFKGIVDYNTRLSTLKHMVRAWLLMTDREGLETWISHGTLLGWWWNGQVRTASHRSSPPALMWIAQG